MPASGRPAALADAGQAREAAVAALRRIAWLLESAQASPYRSDAFRTAAHLVQALDPRELVSRVEAGTVADLHGIGARTARVISAAVHTEPVEYLDDLERDRASNSADGPGAALRSALRGDLHTHTDASDGRAPLAEMVGAAIELGHDYVAITDHSPRLTIAHGLSAERLRAQLAHIEALRPVVAPFEVLTGIEVDILDDGGLDQRDDVLGELDVVVASVHSGLRMPRAAMNRRMVAAVSNPRVDVLGHCTGRQLTGTLRPESDFDPAEVFGACAAHGVAVEINCRPDRLDPPHALLQVAIAAGCDVTIDSDAHAPGQLDWLGAGCERAAAHDLPADRVVTTWPLERLLTRLRSAS